MLFVEFPERNFLSPYYPDSLKNNKHSYLPALIPTISPFVLLSAFNDLILCSKACSNEMDQYFSNTVHMAINIMIKYLEQDRERVYNTPACTPQ